MLGDRLDHTQDKEKLIEFVSVRCFFDFINFIKQRDHKFGNILH